MKLISILILTFLLSGCFIFGDPVEFDETTGQTPQWILSRGEAYASNSDWPAAIRVLEKGEQRYPNSKLAPQFKLDLAYSYYRFSQDAEARRKVEVAAVEAVMAVERKLGYNPRSVEALKIGYDVESYDPKTGHMRFIEVKGRVDTADSVMITRQEIITSMHEPDKFILAIVQVADGVAYAPRYVCGALDIREPPFDQNAIQFHIKRLLNRSEDPA